jgi:hypothetical protein
MATFTNLVNAVTRRGGFALSRHMDAVKGYETTWLVTKQDDVLSTDIRDGSSAVIPASDIVELLNASKNAADALEALKNLTGDITSQRIAELFEKYNL